MPTFNIQINKQRKKLKIIRNKNKIQEYLAEYEHRRMLKMGLLENEMRDGNIMPSIPIPQVQEQYDLEEAEKEKQKQEELANKKGFRTRFIQEFVFSNEQVPIELSLDKVQEDMLPISVVRQEIQKSYDKGLEDGQISARAVYQTEMDKYTEWVRQIETVSENLKTEHRKAVKSFEASLVDLSFLIAEEIIGLEVHSKNNIIVRQVKRAIDSVHNEKIFRISLHPSTIEIMEKFKVNLLEDDEEARQIVLHADKNIPMGGCVIETSAGLIDGRIKHQLKELHKILSEEIYRPIEDSERENELNAIYSHEQSEALEKEIDISQEVLERVEELSDFNYSDMPEEYKDMFSPDIFDEGSMQDMDADGNIIIEKEELEAEPEETEYDPSAAFADMDFELDNDEVPFSPESNLDDEDKDDVLPDDFEIGIEKIIQSEDLEPDNDDNADEDFKFGEEDIEL